MTNGFTGNVVLKVSEAAADALATMIQQEMSRTIFSRLTTMGSWPALARLHRGIGCGKYGGAPLLGLKGVAIVCHGRSSPEAIKNAIRVAHDFIGRGRNEENKEGIRGLSPLRQPMGAV